MPDPELPCQTLPDIIERQARQGPERTALWWQTSAISFGELHLRIQRLARALSGSGQPGDRVAVLAWNCPAFIELIYAVPAARQVLVPLNARLAAAEWCDQLQRSGATRLFADPDLLAGLEGHPGLPASLEIIPLDATCDAWLDAAPAGTLSPCEPDAPVWILFTSGSTGKPKGAVLTHASFMAGLRSAAIGRPVDRDDRYFYPFPLFHVAAHNVLLQHLFGAGVVLTRAFDARETLLACRELGVTTLSLAPTMIAMLLDCPDYRPEDFSGVRTIGYGASAMPVTLLEQLLRTTRVGLCQSYGMTELSGSVAFLTVDDHRAAAAGETALLTSVGHPLPTAEIRLVDDDGTECAIDEPGEILVRAGQCMAGYWDDDEATAAALAGGWLHTGDIGRFDDRGYLYIVDRKKDMILSGGENVASREVEEVLRRHEAVKDCAVIGLPDPRWGECVSAAVQLEKAVSDAALAEHCRQSLAGYKTPRRWFRVGALPLNAAGKVDKPALRRQFSDRPQRGQ